MSIDISHLSVDELIALNHQVVERIKFMRSMQAHEKMLEFCTGDTVSFQDNGGKQHLAKIIKFNKKTVSVMSDEGHQFNVPPQLLTRVQAPIGVIEHK